MELYGISKEEFESSLLFKKGATWEVVEVKKILGRYDVCFLNSSPIPAWMVITHKSRDGESIHFDLFQQEGTVCKCMGLRMTSLLATVVDRRFGLCDSTLTFVHLEVPNLHPKIKVYSFADDSTNEVLVGRDEAVLELLHEGDGDGESIVSFVDFLFLGNGDLLFACGRVTFLVDMSLHAIKKRILVEKKEVCYVGLKYFHALGRNDEFFLYDCIPSQSKQFGTIYNIKRRKKELSVAKVKKIDISKFRLVGSVDPSKTTIITVQKDSNLLQVRSFPDFQLEKEIDPFIRGEARRICEYSFFKVGDRNVVFVEYQASIASHWWRTIKKHLLLDYERDEVCFLEKGRSRTKLEGLYRGVEISRKAVPDFKIYNDRVLVFPVDCLLRVFLFLDFQDIITKVEPLCCAFYNSNFLWKMLFRSHFKISHFYDDSNFRTKDNKEEYVDCSVNYKGEYICRKNMEESFLFVKKKWEKCHSGSNSVTFV